MKRQTRAFTVEMKRSRRSKADAASLWSDTPEIAAATPEAIPLNPDDPCDPGEDLTSALRGSAASTKPEPRILQDHKPSWTPATPEAIKRKRGRPRKTPLISDEDVSQSIEPEQIVQPEDDLLVAAEHPLAEISSEEADASPTLDDSHRPRRRLAKPKIGERWKRHLPRWKR